MGRLLCLALLLSLPLAARAVAESAPDTVANDYPTSARADYVYACMATNGGTQDALRRRSCSIDVIASLLSYDRYEAADTVMSMRRQVGGYLAETFRTKLADTMVRQLQDAQAEAEVRCF